MGLFVCAKPWRAELHPHFQPLQSTLPSIKAGGALPCPAMLPHPPGDVLHRNPNTQEYP